MSARTRSLVVLSAGLACALASSCARSRVEPRAAEPSSAATTKAPASAPAEAPMPTPPTPAPPALTVSADPFVRPAPVGETFSLERRQSHRTEGGLVVTYAGHSHKRPRVGGPTAQMIRLLFERRDQRQEIELRGSDNVLEGELDALGALVVVRGSFASVEVTVVATPAPPPLDEDEAWGLIEQTAARYGLAAKNSAGGSVVDGVLRYQAALDKQTVWSARLGTYTRRLWFLKPGDEPPASE